MNRANFATGTVSTAPSPANSGTSLILQSGEGSHFPAVPFYVTAAPDGFRATFSNAEVLKVTNVVGDTFTIVRAQKGTFAKNIDATWRISQAIYAEDFSDDVYVSDFGAVGDNATDDTSAIQAAVDFAIANRGRNVVFDAKTYKVTDSIDLGSYVGLIGKGGSQSNANGTIIRSTSTSAPIILADITTTSMTTCNIKGIRLEGAFSGTGNHGIYFKNTGSGGVYKPYTYFNFEDLYIVGCDIGFNVECLIVSSLKNVICETNNTGFFFNGSAHGGFSTVNTSCNLTSCFANGNADVGFNFDHCTYMSLANCAADSNGTSYVINACQSMALNGCGYEYGPVDSASPGDGYVISGGSSNIGLYDCHSLYNKSIACWVKDSSYAITVVGFNENSPVGSATASFKVEASSIVTLIDPNYTTAVDNAGTLTFLTDGSGGMSIPGASFFNNTLYVADALTLDNNIHMLPYQQIQDQAGHPILELGAYGTPANYIGVETAEAGGPAVIYAAGTDTNIDVNIVPKGSGVLKIKGSPISGGGGDASTNTSSSVDSEIALFSGTGGKTLKRATGTGIAKITSGVLSTGTAGTDYLTPGATQTVTATRVNPRVTSISSSATPTVNTDTTDFVDITALAAAITSMTTNLSGTPVNGQRLMYRIKDNGTSRSITWGASFEACGQALPTTTTTSKRTTVGFIYDSTTSKWGCVAVVTEA